MLFRSETPGIGRLFSELLQKPKVMQSHIGSLTKPEKMLFISASIVSKDDRGQLSLSMFSDDPKRNARIIGLKFSALQALLSALRVRDDQSGEYLSGDMLSMGAAKLLTILPESFSSGQKKVMGIGADGEETFFCPAYAKSANGQYVVGYPPQDRRSSFTHFVVLHDTYNGQSVSLEPVAERIEREAGTWDQHLNILSYEEQAELLAPAFPREALEFAWQEHPEYLRALSKRPAASSTARAEDESHDEDADVEAAFSRQPRLAPQKSTATPVRHPQPATPPAEEAEISEEDAAGVADIFASAPPTTAVPAPATGPASAGKLNAADILARAKSRLAGNK